MDRTETAVFTNMCLVCDGDRILVQDRVKKDWSGITFPGGHVEPGESFLESTIREVYEETGLTISNLRLCGIKQWIPADGSYRYVVTLYRTNTFTGTLKSSGEGRVFWIDRKDIGRYELADGVKDVLEVFEDDSLSELVYWFEDGTLKVRNR